MSKVYIGIKECGCVTCAVSSELIEFDETLKEWIGRGMKIELVEVEEARERLGYCECSEKKSSTNGVKE